MTPDRRLKILRILSLVFVVGIVVLIYIYRDQLQELARYGYAGIFMITLIANATVFVPVPGVIVVFALGAVFHPLITAVFAGLGGATGELSGYLLGFSGQGLAEQSERYQRMLDWLGKHQNLRDLAVVVLAAIPNPFFDLAGIAAGTLKVPIYRFWFFCSIGSITKYAIFAYAGSTFLKFFYD
jgi:membrane protein YqaA with SNARE-associated domain